jgi:tetratricopeptide (TPR) repeat protein
MWWYRPANAENRYNKMSLVSLRQMLDREPDNAKAWRQFAIRLAGVGDASMAEPALIRSLELNPNDPTLATGLGEILMASDRYPEAFQVLKAATAAHPKDVMTHRALGELYVRKESFMHAYDQFAIVVEADKKADYAWYQMAACSLQMQQFAKAQEAIKHAIDIKPDSPQYLAEEGAIAIAVGKVNDGIAETEKAARLAPSDAGLQSTFISLLLDQHRDAADLASAEAAIGRLEQISPNYPSVPYLRGKLEMLRQNWPSAAMYLEIALRAAPHHDEVRLALSQTFRRMNRVTDADALLKIYRHRQDLRSQIVTLQTALGDAPHNRKLYEQLADVQMQLGDPPAAIEVMKTGVQMNPQDAQLQKWLTQLYQAASARR